MCVIWHQNINGICNILQNTFNRVILVDRVNTISLFPFQKWISKTGNERKMETKAFPCKHGTFKIGKTDS